MRNKLHKNTKQLRQLTMTISIFLLGREELKNTVWNIATAEYKHEQNQVEIGISTVDGEFGTTLAKLRKSARLLSQYLFDHGLTFRRSRIHYYIATENAELAKIEHLLDTLDAQLKR